MTEQQRAKHLSWVKETLVGKSYQERICLYSAKKRELESNNVPVIGELHQELIALYRV